MSYPSQPPSAARARVRAPRFSGMPVGDARGKLAYRVLAAAMAGLCLYIAAAILIDVPVSSLLTVIGVAAALMLWRLPSGARQIADAVVLGLVVIALYTTGLDLLSILLVGMVGALALTRSAPAWLLLATGVVGVAAGWSSITVAMNRMLVPRLIVESVPGIDLHLPVMLLGLLTVAISVGLVAVATWRFALRIDLLAIALFVAAGSHFVAGLLGLVSVTVPMLLADLFPGVYSFDEESAAGYSAMFTVLAMRQADIFMIAVAPLVFGVAAIVRLVRQPTFALRGVALRPTSVTVAGLTALALAVPGALMVALALMDANNPLQVALPFVIDGVALLLWVIAAVAWWHHMAPVREKHAPGGDVTTTDLAVTLVLAAAPGLLAVFDLALAFVP
ncbi:hypothetical protein [Kribbia dieselivorans]|uniref:hypothetical protein n=1 Tax=Kribbia dieselivorans TaxID=331526 RepID=UPI000839451C|nr:hypothetical protein [Kribbia dieselivorans]